MKRLEPGTELDGFLIGDCAHSGGFAHIYRVTGPALSFPLMMKVPRMSQSDGSESLVSFEVEKQVLAVLGGPHVPRLVAYGDLAHRPYLVMEWIEGKVLSAFLEGDRPSFETIARIGAALARAAHDLHQQGVVHLDIKPANVILRPDGVAVMIDFGLAHHSAYPDLLAEEMRRAVGSGPYLSPEQVVGVRNDPRSDVFSIGVTLYELSTRELPYGTPSSTHGLRRRLWADPIPPRALAPEMPPWLQEVILRCLEVDPQNRYATAEQIAFDLDNPVHVTLTERSRRLRRVKLGQRIKAWIRAGGLEHRQVQAAAEAHAASDTPVVMVAIATSHTNDATQVALRKAVERALAEDPQSRLSCVTIIPPTPLMTGGNDDLSETSIHRQHMVRLQAWAQPLQLPAQRLSYHVIEGGDPAKALLAYATGNPVSLIVIGSPPAGSGLIGPRASVAARVAAEAPCSVYLVRAQAPFKQLERLLATEDRTATT